MGLPFIDLLAGDQEASAERQQGAFAAKLSGINQRLDAQKAQAALAQGNYLAGQARMRGSQTLGAQTTAYASAGVDTGYGTAASTGLSTRAMADMDAMIAQNNAAREAWGYKVQGLQDKWQGQLASWGLEDKAEATMLTAGIQNAGDTLSLAFMGGGGSSRGGRVSGTSGMYGAGSNMAASSAISGIR